jgi:hypothetical protein
MMNVERNRSTSANDNRFCRPYEIEGLASCERIKDGVSAVGRIDRNADGLFLAGFQRFRTVSRLGSTPRKNNSISWMQVFLDKRTISKLKVTVRKYTREARF